VNNTQIMNILKTTGQPVAFQTYAGTTFPYITFFFYDENGALYADDVEDKTNWYVQVNIFSKGSYTALVEQVKQLMIDAGFTRRSAQDLYESDTKLFHKALRFQYTG